MFSIELSSAISISLLGGCGQGSRVLQHLIARTYCIDFWLVSLGERHENTYLYRNVRLASGDSVLSGNPARRVLLQGRFVSRMLSRVRVRAISQSPPEVGGGGLGGNLDGSG